MKQNVKRKAAIGAGIPGLADGGQPSPGILGWGMARRAGEALQGRGRTIDAAVDAAVNGTPAQPAQPQRPRVAAIPGYADGGIPNPRPLLGRGVLGAAGDAVANNFRNIDSAVDRAVNGTPAAPAVAPAGRGGLSGIRDSAVPPVAMLAAQRRGLADGGRPGRGNAKQLEAGHGGAVRGPGGPTEDRVGPVALSPKEYVLPADTVQALGGPEKLDQIRAATHKFVDPANRPAIANGLADGGVPGYTVSDVPVEEISMGRSAADRAAIDSSIRAGKLPPGMARNPTFTPALDRVSAQMQAAAANAPKIGTMGKIARGGAPIAAGMAVADSMKDDSTARFAKRFGVSEPTGDGSIGDMAKFAALRAGGFASDLGNELTLGAAGNFYADKPDGVLQFSKPAIASVPSAAAPGKPGAQVPTGTPAAPAATAAPTQAAPSSGTLDTGAAPTTTPVNVTREPNGTMSFSGSGPVAGYSGAAAGQLKGGGYSGAVTDADYRAAVARGEADKAAAAKLDQAPAISMSLPETFGDMMQFRAALALAKVNQHAQSDAAQNETARARIAAEQGMSQARIDAEKPLSDEKLKIAQLENRSAASKASLIDTYLNGTDPTARESALDRLNALNGQSDKYTTVDVSDTDQFGNPVNRKVAINKRTGQPLDLSGAGASGSSAKPSYKEGQKLRGPDGKVYEVKNGEPVLVQ